MGCSNRHIRREPVPFLAIWAQRDDQHWFGARIPAAAQSVEFVEAAATGHSGNYRRFAGGGLMESHLAPARLPNLVARMDRHDGSHANMVA